MFQVKALVLALFIVGTSVLPAFAATPERTVNASAKLAYNLKGLNHNLAVQKAYVADKYLYVTQRSTGNVYLSRLLINGSDATYVDEMTITRSGHGQTLDMYTYNDVNYFYISSKTDPSTTQFWSLQVARIQYSPGESMDYTELPRFTYLNYANKKGTSLGETYRVDGGGNNTHTFFRVQNTEGNVTWSIYDTVSLNKLLDERKKVRMDGAAAVNACVASFTQTDSAVVRPNGSFQGADLLGKTEIYTSGGAEGDTPQIAKMSSNGAFKTLVKITNVGPHEIEGVQTQNGNVYFVIVTDPVNKKDTQKVYYVPESVFK